MQHQDTTDPVARAEDILNTMFLLCKHLSLYSEGNTVVETTTALFFDKIAQAQQQQIELIFTVSKKGFFFAGEKLNPKHQLFSRFARQLFQHGMSSFTLSDELTRPSLYAFLRLILGKTADTWDEGGLGACLQNRGVVGITVTEMSENDFRLLNTDADQDQIDDLRASEDLWNRFAVSVFNSLTGIELEALASGETAPRSLAEKVNEILADCSDEQKTALTRDLAEYVASMQREKIKTAKTAALLNLADFVNTLDQDLRNTVFNGISNLQMATEYAEDFFNGLSDQVILDVFRQSTEQQSYAPPVVMSLISKLASTRKLVSDEELEQHSRYQQESAKKIRELFRPDEFEKYVPSRYQQALMQVLTNQQTPPGLNKKLQELKQSLEDFEMEAQMTRLTLHLLENDPDDIYLEGLHVQLANAMQFHLDHGNYVALLDLCRTCLANKDAPKTQAIIALLPKTFTEQVLRDVSRLGRDTHPLIAKVIAQIGAPFARPLIDLTIQEDDRSIRFFYLNCLKKMGIQAADYAVPFLGDDRWFVQRNMLILLGELGARDKLPQIRPLLHSGHAKVRQEALKTCLMLRDDESLKKLVSTLSSGNRQDVLHAITMSQLSTNPQLSAILLKMLKKKELFSFDFDIKKALVQTLAEQKNPQALVVFSEMLRATHFFKASLYNRFKIEIVKALGRYPAAQVSTLLRQQIDHGTEETASQARSLLKKMTQEES